MRDVICQFTEGPTTLPWAPPVPMPQPSARVLHLMHTDLAEKGVGLGSEMSPTSWALYCGPRSVQIAPSVYHAQPWDPEGLNGCANSGERGTIDARSETVRI